MQSRQWHWFEVMYSIIPPTFGHVSSLQWNCQSFMDPVARPVGNGKRWLPCPMTTTHTNSQRPRSHMFTQEHWYFVSINKTSVVICCHPKKSQKSRDETETQHLLRCVASRLGGEALIRELLAAYLAEQRGVTKAELQQSMQELKSGASENWIKTRSKLTLCHGVPCFIIYI